MSIFVTLSLSSGLAFPGQPVPTTVTVFNSGVVAVNVLSIQGMLYAGGTNQARVPGFHGSYGTGPGMTTSVPAGGNISIQGGLVLHGSQMFESDPAGDMAASVVSEAEIESTLAYDAQVVVQTSDGGYTYSPRAQVAYQPAVFAELDGPSNITASPQPAPGQLWGNFASQSGVEAAVLWG